MAQRRWKLTINGRVCGYFLSEHGAAIELGRLASNAAKENRNVIDARIEFFEPPMPRTEQPKPLSTSVSPEHTLRPDMQPGDVYQMTWSDKRFTYLMVVEDIDADLVLMRKWIHARKAWTKHGMPMQKLHVSSGRKLSADERAKLT